MVRSNDTTNLPIRWMVRFWRWSRVNFDNSFQRNDMSNLVDYRITKLNNIGGRPIWYITGQLTKTAKLGGLPICSMIASFTKSCRSKITEFQHWDACNILTYPPKKTMFQKPMVFSTYSSPLKLPWWGRAPSNCRGTLSFLYKMGGPGWRHLYKMECAKKTLENDRAPTYTGDSWWIEKVDVISIIFGGHMSMYKNKDSFCRHAPGHSRSPLQNE